MSTYRPRDICPFCNTIAAVYRAHPSGIVMTCARSHRWLKKPDSDDVERWTDSPRRTVPNPTAYQSIEADTIALECEDERWDNLKKAPCGRPAVGWRYDNEGNLYPVCVGHVRHPMRYLLDEEDDR